MGMRQTNVNLEEWQYQRLKELAAKEKKSLSQLFRELVQERFELEEEEVERDPIFEISAMGRGEGGGVAREHDKILYRKSE